MKKFTWAVLGAVLFTSQALPAAAQDATNNTLTGDLAARYPATGTGLGIAGSIDEMVVFDPDYLWSAGTITVAGTKILIPENLLIDLPANRLTLQQLFQQAPPLARAHGKSGLATSDYDCAPTSIATVIGNRNRHGNFIAGEIVIDKNTEEMQGQVTFINHDEGWFRVNGDTGDGNTGKMVRINDPPARHSIQPNTGPGCLPLEGFDGLMGTDDDQTNCSPDLRFGGDPDNYTVLFVTGYPVGIPSTVPLMDREGFDAMVDTGADAGGAGDDPFAPAINRPNSGFPSVGGTDGFGSISPDKVVVGDSFRFAPLQVGDNIIAAGNFENINGTQFLSAHTLVVEDALFTEESDLTPSPDYLVWEEVEWDAPNFANLRVKCLYIGFCSTRGAEIDYFGLHVDPVTGENTERLFMTTRLNVGPDMIPGTPDDARTPGGDPNLARVGVEPHAGGAFKTNIDLDFIDPPFAGINFKRSPCSNLIRGGILVPDPTGYGPNGINEGGADGMGGFLGDDGPIGGQMVSPCPLEASGSFLPNLNENVHLMSPNPREMIGKSRRKLLNPELEVRDISGNEATWGEYLTPVGFGHPEMSEVDMGGWGQPHIFTGAPWIMDRRLGTGGLGDEGYGDDGRLSTTADNGTLTPLDPTSGTATGIMDGTDPGTGKGFTLNPFPYSESGTAFPLIRMSPVGFLQQALAPGEAQLLAAFGPDGTAVTQTATPVGAQPFTFFPFGATDVLGGAPLLANANVQNRAAGLAPAAPLDLLSDVLGGYDLSISADTFNVPNAEQPPPPAPVVSIVNTMLPMGMGSADITDPAVERTVGYEAVLAEVDKVDAGPAAAFFWNFGDGETGTGNPIEHVFEDEGTFIANVTAVGPGGASAPVSGQAFEIIGAAPFNTPVASFSANPPLGEAPLLVNFTDLSDVASSGIPNAPITLREWNFGDAGSVDNLQSFLVATNPSHTYVSPGTYTVTLTVTGPGGSNTTMQDVTAVAPAAPTASLLALAGGVAPAAGVQTLTVDFTDASSGNITTRTLNFGDGSPLVTSMGAPAAPLSLTHPYLLAGTFTATLTVQNLGGSSTSQQIITVDPFLSEVRLQPRGGNIGRIRTRNTNGIAVSSELDFGDGSPTVVLLPPFQILHNYGAPGTFTATLTTMDVFGNVSVSTSTAVIN